MTPEAIAAVSTRLQQTDVRARFWSRVIKNGPVPGHCQELGPCWQWTGAVSGAYGNFALWVPSMGSTLSLVAHRVAWVITRNDWPADKLLHRCDNRLCVNPGHLREGSSKDNTADMDAKGRRAKGYRKSHGIGSNHGRAKLTEHVVVSCRQRAAAGEPISALAREFGVAPAAVRQAVNRQTWRHVR